VAASVASTAGAYTIQVGAFSSRANAEALVGKIRGNAPDGRIIASTGDGKPVFRVVIGSFGSPAEAASRSRELAKAGLSTFVRRSN
jgi:cell division protein FtsN